MEAKLNKLPKVILSTASVDKINRREWLQDIISREYTKVEVIPHANVNVFNEMSLYNLDKLRLSVIRSNALTIHRKKHEPYHDSQDNYLGVVLLSGGYRLEQDGREVFLNSGDMTIYDATRPHQISSSRSFSKILITIPRAMMRARLPGVEHCTALRIPGNLGIGAITASFIQSIVRETENMSDWGISALSEQSLDLFTLSLASLNSQSYSLSRSRSAALHSIKDFVERHLSDPILDTAMVVAGTGFSARYINDLLNDYNTSLMRYILQRRLERCSKDLLHLLHTNHNISEIALNWGFNDLSHFSRTFKQKYGCTPNQYRHDYSALSQR
ncbi:MULTISPECIES: helix-turn-helix domain-containing protein [Methylotenera]|uniref:AraC-like ligand-binding domain-containing protein n=1 Tax=Methylotenera TaxID=359407 RepID=UPI00037351B5|nr:MULTISPECIES: helix-turn-helix domain-containing protein [Methylotenera]